MYNRYIPGTGGYTRVTVNEKENPTSRAGAQERSSSGGQPHGGYRQSDRPRTGSGPQDMLKKLSAPLSFLGGEDKNAGMAGILKSLHLEDLDSGDILLLLIILFVFLEGDNIELVITLGLMLLLGLGEEKKEDQKE